MKVLFTTPTIDAKFGGISRSLPELANALACSEIEVELFYPASSDRAGILNNTACLREWPLGQTATGSQSSLREALERIVDEGCAKHDILIHHSGIWLPFAGAVARFARGRKLPLIVAPRGMLEPWAINNSKWKKKLAWMLYQKRDLERVTAFHATALSEAGSIRALGFKQPIAVIPNGVQLPEAIEFEGSKVGRCEGAEKTALFLSRISPKKGLPMLLDAWKKLAPTDWRLVIAGNDDSNHLPVLERQIAELGLSDQVELVGPLFGDAKEQAYLNADLFVLPSYSENFGIVVTEALGYQLPVLTTTGCPWEELETERCGWWVEPTPAGIEAGLKSALEASDAERAAMGERGRELVKNKYLWPAIANDMARFYQWLLGNGDKPDFVIE